MNGTGAGSRKAFRVARGPALALLVAGCGGGCDATEPSTPTIVQIGGSGDGSGVVAVHTPYVSEPDWQCTIVNGQGTGTCSRTYDARGGLEVHFSAQGTDGHFSGWSGVCSGTSSECVAVGSTFLNVVAAFEAPIGAVALEIDGRSDAVTVLQGLTLGAVATATKSNGQPASGATFTWMSSDPSTVSVSGSSTGNATVRGEAPGSAQVTAASDGVTSNAVTVTVLAPQSAKGILEGILYDVDGTTPLDSVSLSGGPVSGSQGDALRGKSGRQNPLDPGGIPTGGYRFEATNGRYAMFSVGVIGRRYLSTPGDTADVLADQTTILDLFVADGYGLDMLGTDLGTVQATPGETINVTVDYRAWNRDLCPGCVPSLGIGVDATALAVYRFGIPGTYPGKTETAVSIPITVPDHGGTIYATLITVSTSDTNIEPGLQLYRDRWAANVQGTTMIPIGTLVLN